MPPVFLRAYPPAEPASGPAFWLPFHNGELLVRRGEGGVVPVHGEATALEALQPGTPLYLGMVDGTPCLACEVSPEAVPDDWSALGLRALFGRLDDPFYGLAGYATQLLAWQRTSRYCPACGQLTAPVPGEWGRRCPACGYTRYPPVSPAVLILIHDGDKVLLGHQPGWGRRYSILAGFVEPGESLEECVRREVFEEVKLEVANLTYRGSQPWPFPHQLMCGFTARYASGEIRFNPRELDDAAWFHVDALPELPAPLSLSRQLLDAWAASRRASP